MLSSFTRRLGTVVGAAALVVTGLGIAGASAASASPVGGTASLGAIHTSGPAGTPVTSGSVWTAYSLEFGGHYWCFIDSFGPKTYVDDKGGGGTYKSTTKKTKMVMNNPFVLSPLTFSGTWNSGDGGYWTGEMTYAGTTTFGPMILAPGADPFGWGTC